MKERQATFRVPASGYATFGRDAGEGYAHRRGRVSLRVIGETSGSVWGRVRLDASEDGPAAEVSFEAESFVAFQRRFQAMVAFGHDGSPAERDVAWGDDAFWLASVPWSLDSRSPN